MSTFGSDQFMLLQALADYAAIAIDNARAVEKIQELTITDDCTGLYNARHLYSTIESEVYRSTASATSSASCSSTLTASNWSMTITATSSAAACSTKSAPPLRAASALSTTLSATVAMNS